MHIVKKKSDTLRAYSSYGIQFMSLAYKMFTVPQSVTPSKLKQVWYTQVVKVCKLFIHF